MKCGPSTGFRTGIPIGNLTSQIFANIYLHELDRFVLHTIKPLKYLRYGDDFVLFGAKKQNVMEWRETVKHFLENELHLPLHPQNDVIKSCRQGLFMLGCEIYPSGMRLKKRMWNRMVGRLQWKNISSYSGVVRRVRNIKRRRLFDWIALGKIFYL